MARMIRIAEMRLALCLVFAVAVLLLAGPSVRAYGGTQEEKSSGDETRPRRVNESAQTATSEKEPLQVAYVLYDRTLTTAAESESFVVMPGAAPRTLGTPVPSLLQPPTYPVPAGMPAPPAKSSSVASTAPMTVGEKFGTWFHGRFLTPGAYIGAVVNGMWKELNDNDDFKEDTVGNYFADSMTRAARSFALSTTGGFFERALLPSIFKQDPRYHKMPGKNSPKARLLYAATRVFVTQGDNCACHQVNWSFLLGDGATTAIANLWERSERTGPWHNVRRYATHISLSALGNILREFISGQ